MDLNYYMVVRVNGILSLLGELYFQMSCFYKRIASDLYWKQNNSQQVMCNSSKWLIVSLNIKTSE